MLFPFKSEAVLRPLPKASRHSDLAGGKTPPRSAMDPQGGRWER